MAYSLQQAAGLALDVQDACNLSGTVRSLKEILCTTLADQPNPENHPVTVLFVDKFASLSRTQFEEFPLSVREAIANLNWLLMDVLLPIAHQEGSGKGTDWVNQHPVTKMCVQYLRTQCRLVNDDLETFSRAYDGCLRLAGREREEATSKL